MTRTQITHTTSTHTTSKHSTTLARHSFIETYLFASFASQHCNTVTKNSFQPLLRLLHTMLQLVTFCNILIQNVANQKLRKLPWLYAARQIDAVRN